MSAGTVLGLAGTDLVLPALPSLPQHLGGDAAQAQLVVAAFVAGTAVGLLVFGALGPRFGRQPTLVAALVGYALSSLACSSSVHMSTLIALRFVQGLTASAPAVFAPALIRSLFDDHGATKALGVLGSIEALAPAFAPAIGVALLHFGGWQASFLVTAILATLLVVAIKSMGALPSQPQPNHGTGSYMALLLRPRFLRYAVSHALVLAGLLVFVFGTPVVVVQSMHGNLGHFIAMQIVGIACFIVAANVSPHLVHRFGAEPVILAGTTLAALSALLILLYALNGGNDPKLLVYLFFPLNTGLGIRAPPGFLQAIKAGDGDDERAASLAILAIMGATAAGTAIVAPFIHHGLVATATAATVAEFMGLATLLLLPPARARQTDPAPM